MALSTPGARLRIGLPAVLAELEDGLRSLSTTHVVVLQPMYYMENFLASIPLIREAGILGGAVKAELPLPMIATRDVAAVAAEHLADPRFHGHSVRRLLGPRDYTFREAASILGSAIGRPKLEYVEMPMESVRQALIGSGVSISAAEAFTAMVEALNSGEMLRGLARDASSRTPTTMEEFAATVFAPAFHGIAVGEAPPVG